MSNKLKEQLRLKMLGQLSDEKTKLDIDNAYDVCKDFSVSFLAFCGKNTISYNETQDKWRMKILYPTFKTTEELFNIYLENYEK